MRSVRFPSFLGAIAVVSTTVVGGVGCVEGTLELNEPMPVADAGFDQILYLRGADTKTVDLYGLGSCDPQRAGLDDERWKLVDGPSGAQEEISFQGNLRAVYVAEGAGDYLIGLQVAAGERESPMDYVLISVREGDGDDVVVLPPEINACGDRIAVDGR